MQGFKFVVAVAFVCSNAFAGIPEKFAVDFAAPIVGNKSNMTGDVPFGSIVFDLRLEVFTV